MVKVYIQHDGLLPAYAHETDAGIDVCAAEDTVIAPGETKLVRTGLKMAIPEGYECQIRPRSGISLNTPLRIPNAPGTIDSGYRGEVCVIMQNTSCPFYPGCDDEMFVMRNASYNHYLISQKGNKPGWYDIKKGDRIAQLVFAKYEKAEFEVIEDVKNICGDRGGGFGSTGV